MSDTLLRAIARDAGIQICAASTTELVERAHEIHNTTPLATAALGRTLTATAIMGSQLKVEDGSVTVQIKGNGPLGAIVCVGDSDGYVRGYLQDPAVDLPLRADLDEHGLIGKIAALCIEVTQMAIHPGPPSRFGESQGFAAGGSQCLPRGFLATQGVGGGQRI